MVKLKTTCFSAHWYKLETPYWWFWSEQLRFTKSSLRYFSTLDHFLRSLNCLRKIHMVRFLIVTNTYSRNTTIFLLILILGTIKVITNIMISWFSIICQYRRTMYVSFVTRHIKVSSIAFSTSTKVLLWNKFYKQSNTQESLNC